MESRDIFPRTEMVRLDRRTVRSNPTAAANIFPPARASELEWRYDRDRHGLVESSRLPLPHFRLPAQALPRPPRPRVKRRTPPALHRPPAADLPPPATGCPSPPDRRPPRRPRPSLPAPPGRSTTRAAAPPHPTPVLLPTVSSSPATSSPSSRIRPGTGSATRPN